MGYTSNIRRSQSVKHQADLDTTHSPSCNLSIREHETSVRTMARENPRMRRGDYERLIQAHLDDTLLPRGFRPTPQPPVDAVDTEPAALYETDPLEFERRYPRLAETVLDGVSCVDLWIKQDPETRILSCELEGVSFDDLLKDAVELPHGTAVGGSLTQQLDALALGIASLLDAHSA